MKKDPINATLAKTYNVTARTIRNWRNEGAPLHDAKLMRAWLAARKNLARGLPMPAATAPDDAADYATGADDTTGAAPALKRLEGEEIAAYSRLRRAIKAGDEIGIRFARDSWLKIGESLRKYDLLVEQSRREAGELVPREHVETALRSFLQGWRLARYAERQDIVGQLIGLTQGWQIERTLEPSDDKGFLGGLFALMGSATPGLRGTFEKIVGEELKHWRMTPADLAGR